MNDLFATLGIESWKAVIGELLLPPVPFVLMVLWGGQLLWRRRRLGWTLLLTGALGTWLMCTFAAGAALTHLLLMPPRSLGTAEIDGLKHAPRAVIVVLGGGTNRQSPEYGMPTLNSFSIERLRYGVWLARKTALPLAFSGGLGHGAEPGPGEAEIAARVAELEFGHALRYTETRSRDTNENALLTLPLLKGQGIEHIVLVTHGYHMPRALAAFERAAERTSTPMKVTPAPLGVADSYDLRPRDWLPSRNGFDRVNRVLHEWLGRVGGA
jgi:uncharacterized SAM-binding protein YcdF (DUF218 family)